MPDDTKEDECPIVTVGTCGGGNRGDGICPFRGYCCSSWGWCGTTDDYCDDDSNVPTPSTVEAAPPAPTISIEAGMCGAQDVGDGLCPGENMCCSDFGYCGAGENYCFSTRALTGDDSEDDDSAGKCGAGGIGDGLCPVVGGTQLCCSRFGFCGMSSDKVYLFHVTVTMTHPGRAVARLRRINRRRRALLYRKQPNHSIGCCRGRGKSQELACPC